MFIFASRDNMSTARQDAAAAASTPRRNRYTRSSTSVTQLLSDSCSSLLQRLTTRVRGPSTATENLNSERKTPILNRRASTRSRFEDKYTAILDRYTNYRKRDEDRDSRRDATTPKNREEKTLEPSAQRTIVKSPRASVLLSEKAYPYVTGGTTSARTFQIDKTPYHQYSRHKSGNSESRRLKNRPNRSGKSEQLEGTSSQALRESRKTIDVDTKTSKALMRKDFARKELEMREFVRKELDKQETARKELEKEDFLRKELNKNNNNNNNNNNDDDDPEKTPIANNGIENDVDNDPVLREREARRKEIQSLILKYAALDEAYNKFGNSGEKEEQSTADKIASKYQKNNLRNENKIANTSNNDAETVTNSIVSCRKRVKRKSLDFFLIRRMIYLSFQVF